MALDAMRAETVRIAGSGGDEIEAYLAQPVGDDRPWGGVVVIHHMPGYDEASKEITRRFAAHRYISICPNLYTRESDGRTTEEIVAGVRASGGVPDDRLVGDVGGAVRFLRSMPECNARVATIGYCSGGRQSFLAACSLELDAAIDCYGGYVVTPPAADSSLTWGSIVGLANNLSCPLLGLFGADDPMPNPEEVGKLASALDAGGKTYEFHTFDNAGHAFFAVDRPMYRPEAATQGWKKVWDFLGRHLITRETSPR